jgi:hypothetical protein
MPFFPSPAKIIYPILKMDDNMHPKSCEKGKFRVTNFSNRIAKLIH